MLSLSVLNIILWIMAQVMSLELNISWWFPMTTVGPTAPLVRLLDYCWATLYFTNS